MDGSDLSKTGGTPMFLAPGIVADVSESAYHLPLAFLPHPHRSSSSQSQMQSQLLPSLQENGNATRSVHLTPASMAIPTSSFTSLASLRSQHTFASLPVAYKMRYTDLVALTKRIRATQWDPATNNNNTGNLGAEMTDRGTPRMYAICVYSALS